MKNCSFKKYSLNLHGQLVEIDRPWVMGILNAIKAGDRKVLFVLPQNSDNIFLSSRNLPEVKVITVDEINTYAIMNANSIVMVDGVQDILAERVR